nr:uncharacterized protein LOC127340345 [Lolium perenne]
MAVAHAVAEAVWIRQLLMELQCPVEHATIVYCDNISAVYMASNHVQHPRTKHIEIDFVREKDALEKVRVLHVPTSAQFVDIFTKGLHPTSFIDIRSSLNIVAPDVNNAGGIRLTLHAFDRDGDHPAQNQRAQTTPRDAHPRQDAHDGNPGRDGTPLCPIASRLPSLCPCTSRLDMTPAASQTTSLARGNPVHDAMIDDHPPLPPECEDDDERHRSSFSPQSRSTAPP